MFLLLESDLDVVSFNDLLIIEIPGNIISYKSDSFMIFLSLLTI